MVAFSPLSRRVRHVQRYAHLLEVLAKHGFADLAERIGLHTLIERGREVLGSAPRGDAVLRTPQERVRRMLEELGPTYIKLGQVLSTRPDLIPPVWADEFKKLQDRVPGVEFEEIARILEAELGSGSESPVCGVERQPLAAASIAQVHRARLRDGTPIVLKVLRPGIREITATDMEILAALAEKAEAYFSDLGFSPTEVANEFARVLAREVDLEHEGRSTDRFRRQFEGDPGIVFPCIYWEATTRNVLALEEMRGIPLSRAREDDIPRPDRRRLVENGTRAVLRQCLEFGFFHADPHPGNLIALPGGRMAFIDCGMTGQLEARTTRQLADLVSGITMGDTDRIVAAIVNLADIGPEAFDDRTLRSDLHAIATQFQGTPLGRLNLGQILQDFFATLRAHRIRCPGDLMLLIKALTTIESVGRWLDPSFEIVEFSKPHVEQLVTQRYSYSAIRTRLRRSVLEYAEFFESIPGELRPLLAQLRRNRLAVNLEHRGLTRLTNTIEHASRNISFALIIAAVLVGSSILILAAREPQLEFMTAVGLGGFVTAAILSVIMVLSSRRSRDE